MSLPGPLAPKRAKKFDSPEQRAYLNLWRTYDRLRAIEDELFGRHDLSPQQYNALRLLRAAQPGGLQTLAVAERLVSRAPDITRLLDKLEERGLVARLRRPENRRVVEVRITPAGLTLLDALAEEVRACHDKQLGHLNARQLAQLVELLQAAREPHEDPEGTWAGS